MKGKRKQEDKKDGSGEGEQECWFGEGGCHESSKMERELERLLPKWGKSGQPPFMGINPDQNWIEVF